MKYLPIIITFATIGMAIIAESIFGFNTNEITIYIFLNFFLYGSIALYFSSKIGRNPEIEKFRKNFCISPFKPVPLAHLPPKIKITILKKHPEIKDFQITKTLASISILIHFFFGLYLSLA
jgi:hypothetical protein